LEDGKPRVLIIDEINRANIPRVFGELMYLLEYRDSKIDLMYHAEQFSLPPNLYIIGTMNTADRSVQGIDLALRRRFDFFELKPDVEVLRNWYKDKENKLGEGLFQGFIALNKHLEDHVGKHLAIGQSYLMRPLMDSKTLDKIWDQQLMPLIEEYFFDRPNHLSDFSRENYWP
jgi:5-methylcytosine-specific restriction protein B